MSYILGLCGNSQIGNPSRVPQETALAGRKPAQGAYGMRGSDKAVAAPYRICLRSRGLFGRLGRAQLISVAVASTLEIPS